MTQCDECTEVSAAWSCESCEQTLCAECDKWIHAVGTLAQHERTPVVVAAPPPPCSRCQQPSTIYCEVCIDVFCQACSTRMHAKGARAQHTLATVDKRPKDAATVNVATPVPALSSSSSASVPSVATAPAVPPPRPRPTTLPPPPPSSSSAAKSSAPVPSSSSSAAAAVPSSIAVNSLSVHAGVSCDGCGMNPLRGERFRCDECPNFDLCQRCWFEGRTTLRHGVSHAMSKITHPNASPMRLSQAVKPIKGNLWNHSLGDVIETIDHEHPLIFTPAENRSAGCTKCGENHGIAHYYKCTISNCTFVAHATCIVRRGDENKCTFTFSGTSFKKQSFYNCFTCAPGKSLGFCQACLVCHEGHKISKREIGDFFCDCGSGGFGQFSNCKCLSQEATQLQIQAKAEAAKIVRRYLISIPLDPYHLHFNQTHRAACSGYFLDTKNPCTNVLIFGVRYTLLTHRVTEKHTRHEKSYELCQDCYLHARIISESQPPEWTRVVQPDFVFLLLPRAPQSLLIEEPHHYELLKPTESVYKPLIEKMKQDPEFTDMSIRHEGIVCRMCLQTIVGGRYLCLSCHASPEGTFDLCTTCHRDHQAGVLAKTGANLPQETCDKFQHHSTHLFCHLIFPIPLGRKNGKIYHGKADMFSRTFHHGVGGWPVFPENTFECLPHEMRAKRRARIETDPIYESLMKLPLAPTMHKNEARVPFKDSSLIYQYPKPSPSLIKPSSSSTPSSSSLSKANSQPGYESKEDDMSFVEVENYQARLIEESASLLTASLPADDENNPYSASYAENEEYSREYAESYKAKAAAAAAANGDGSAAANGGASSSSGMLPAPKLSYAFCPDSPIWKAYCAIDPHDPNAQYQHGVTLLQKYESRLLVPPAQWTFEEREGISLVEVCFDHTYELNPNHAASIYQYGRLIHLTQQKEKYPVAITRLQTVTHDEIGLPKTSDEWIRAIDILTSLQMIVPATLEDALQSCQRALDELKRRQKVSANSVAAGHAASLATDSPNIDNSTVIASNKRDTLYLSNFLHKRGAICWRLSRVDEALEAFEQLIEINPTANIPFEIIRKQKEQQHVKALIALGKSKGEDVGAAAVAVPPAASPASDKVPASVPQLNGEPSSSSSSSGPQQDDIDSAAYAAYSTPRSLVLDGSVEKEGQVEYGAYSVSYDETDPNANVNASAVVASSPTAAANVAATPSGKPPRPKALPPPPSSSGGNSSAPAVPATVAPTPAPASAPAPEAVNAYSRPKEEVQPPGGAGFASYSAYASMEEGYTNQTPNEDNGYTNPPPAGSESQEKVAIVKDAPSSVSASLPPSAPRVNRSHSLLLDAASKRNWNEEYQLLIERQQSLDQQLAPGSRLVSILSPVELSRLRTSRHEVSIQLIQIQNEFALFASQIARVIISELHLPAALKTIRASEDVGGIAGGEKYIVGALFFKFALDLKHLYGSDEFAMKSAACEMKGIKAYKSLNIPSLCSPLVRLVDYLGYRIIVSSLLPLGKNSLVYGSDNQCTTVHQDSQRCNDLMAEAGRRLNLKSHIVGQGEQAKAIYGPGDIEVHEGKDKRFYVIDAARVSPPEAPRFLIPSILLPANEELFESPDQGLRSHSTFHKDGERNKYSLEEKAIKSLSILELNRSNVLNESQTILIQALRDKIRDAQQEEEYIWSQAQEAFDRPSGGLPAQSPFYVSSASAAARKEGVKVSEPAPPLPHAYQDLLQVKCAAMQIAGVMVVYMDFTQEQMQCPFVYINRRVCVLTGRRIYGDCIVIPGFNGTHLYHLLRMEYVREYTGPTLVDSNIQLRKPQGGVSGDSSKKSSSSSSEQAVVPRIPLSSDAFTFFGRSNAVIHNQEVKRATNELLTHRISELAESMLGSKNMYSKDGYLKHSAISGSTSTSESGSSKMEGVNIVSSTQLITVLHSYGVNVRFLGKLRSVLYNESNLPGGDRERNEKRARISALILTEMIARVFKNTIRAKLRGMQRPQPQANELPDLNDFEAVEAYKRYLNNQLNLSIKKLIVKEFNYIFGPHRMRAYTDSNGLLHTTTPSSKVTTQSQEQKDFLASQIDGDLWNDTLKTRIQLKFGLHTPALTPEELKPTCDLGVSMLRLNLLQNLCTTLGLTMKTSSLTKFQESDSNFLSTITPFSIDDIESIDVQVNGDDVEQVGERATLIQDVKKDVVRQQLSQVDALSLAAPLNQRQPESYYSMIKTVLGWFHFRTLATQIQPPHPLLAKSQGPILHQQLRIEARMLDQLIFLFGIDKTPVQQQQPVAQLEGSPGASIRPLPYQQPAIHHELRSTYVEFARLLLRLGSKTERRHCSIDIKSELKEEEVIFACQRVALALIHRALAERMDVTAPAAQLLPITYDDPAGQPTVPIPQIYHDQLPVEILFKSYLLLAQISRQRQLFVNAIDILRETFKQAARCFGWEYLEQTSHTRSGVSGVSPSSCHPFFLPLLEEIISLFHECNLNEYVGGYVSCFLHVIIKFDIPVFSNARHHQEHLSRDTFMRILQANPLLMRNIMHATFMEDVPSAYYSHYGGTKQVELASLLPHKWTSKQPKIVNEEIVPTAHETLSLTNWIEETNFQTALQFEVPVPEWELGTVLGGKVPTPEAGAAPPAAPTNIGVVTVATYNSSVTLRPDLRLISLVPVYPNVRKGTHEWYQQSLSNPIATDHERYLFYWHQGQVPGRVHLLINSMSSLGVGAASAAAQQAAAQSDPANDVLVATQSTQRDTIVVLTRNGSVYANGRAAMGLGVENGVSSFNGSGPLPPLLYSRGMTGKRIISVALGQSHMLLVSDQGLVFSSGLGKYGCLGHGDEQTRDTPRLIEALQNFPDGAAHIVQAYASQFSSMVRSTTGRVYSFGYNSQGALAIGVKIHMSDQQEQQSFHTSISNVDYSQADSLLTPQLVQIPFPVNTLSLTNNASVFLTTNGLVFRSGDWHWLCRSSAARTYMPVLVAAYQTLKTYRNEYGEIQQEEVLDMIHRAPADQSDYIYAPFRFTQVSSSHFHVLLVSHTRRLYVMGRGGYGGHIAWTLGSGNIMTNNTTPTAVRKIEDLPIVYVQASDESSYAITADGRLFSWGNSQNGPSPVLPDVAWTQHERDWILGNDHNSTSQLKQRYFPGEFKIPAYPNKIWEGKSTVEQVYKKRPWNEVCRLKPEHEVVRLVMARNDNQCGLAIGRAANENHVDGDTTHETNATSGFTHALASPSSSSSSSSSSAPAHSSGQYTTPQAASFTLNSFYPVSFSVSSSRGIPLHFFSPHPFSLMLNVSMSQKVYSISNYIANKPSDAQGAPIAVVWDLPYIPLWDDVLIWKKHPNRTLKQLTSNRDGRKYEYRLGDHQPTKFGRSSIPFGMRGERILPDITDPGHYVAMWSMGGQADEYQCITPQVVFEFEVVS